MHPKEEKTILRQEIKKRIEEMTDGERRAEGRTLSRMLLKEIPEGSSVCAYFPLKTEVDIQLLLIELLARGDTVYLPVYDKEKNHMIYRKAENLTDLEAGEFTIPEPTKDAEELDNNAVDIILVPGRAFDEKGNRLGRGSGGFDAWLAVYKAQHPATAVWGISFQCQLVQHIPTEEHDMKMDRVIVAKSLQ